MRVALFLAFLAFAAGYAVWKGGGPERVMAAIALTMVGLDKLLHLFIPPNFVSLDTGHLVIDLFGAGSTVALALLAHRFWPLCIAVLHLMPLLAHTSRLLSAGMHPAAYLAMQVATSWPVPAILILATWRHQRRLARGISEPCWLSSSRPSTPTTAPP